MASRHQRGRLFELADRFNHTAFHRENQLTPGLIRTNYHNAACSAAICEPPVAAFELQANNGSDFGLAPRRLRP